MNALSRSRSVRFHCSALALFLLIFPLPATRAADKAETIRQRLAGAARYLASDELKGRDLGTKGIDLAADYIARRFSEIGLKTEIQDGKPFQSFTVRTDSRMGPAERNRLVITWSPPDKGARGLWLNQELGKDFNPLAIGGSGVFDLPLVFVGYGITSEKANYDDYAGAAVDGKAVIILRHEPQQDNPHSKFEGTKNSRHAAFFRKVSNAFENGAAAIIFCTDEFEIRKNVARHRHGWQAAIRELKDVDMTFQAVKEPTAEQIEEHRGKMVHLAGKISKYGGKVAAHYDPVLPFDGAGPGTGDRTIPVLHCRRNVIDQIVKSAMGKTLAELEQVIDRGPSPQSAELSGWRIMGETNIRSETSTAKNVIGILEGEGPLAEETIVVGAHYDHLGLGGHVSTVPREKGLVHNGADDNASGIAVMIEIARQLSATGGKLPRRIVFAAFTGEESGLLGSSHYVRNPPVPLNNTVAMFNLDMVGRLRDDNLMVLGTGTAKEFDSLLDRINPRGGLKLVKKASGFGPGDHTAFHSKKIPVIHFFTGSHADYHRPSDDFDRLNIDGMRRIASFVAELTKTLAHQKQRPTYLETKQPASGGGSRPYFGSIPDFGRTGGGYTISGVASGGPAAVAGLKGGDVIIRFGAGKIGNLEDFDIALRKCKAGDKVPIQIRRGNRELWFEVTLDPPP